MATLAGTSKDLVFGVQQQQFRQIEGLGLTLKTNAVFETRDDAHCRADDITGTIQSRSGDSR